MIISGRVSIKMAPVVRRVYDQMLEPKWAIAMGACLDSMGVFNNYAIVPADKFLPVDLHIPGCPPRPEALIYGILKLRNMVMAKPDEGWRARYGGGGTEEFDPKEIEVDPRRPRPRSTSPPRPWAGQAPVPDATGLELIAQELRERDADSVLDTEFFREKAAHHRHRGLDPRDARVAAHEGLQLPRVRARRGLLPRGAASRRPVRDAGHDRGGPHHRQGARPAR